MNDLKDVGRWAVLAPEHARFNPYEGSRPLASYLDLDTNSYRWAEHAICCTEDIDPDVFFEHEAKLQRADLALVCQACPVRADCLDYAMAHDVEGWWGGTSRHDRDVMHETLAKMGGRRALRATRP